MELKFTIQAQGNKEFHAGLQTDAGTALLLTALAALSVSALGLWCALAFARRIKSK